MQIQAIVRYYFISIRLLKKLWEFQRFSKNLRSWNSHKLLVGVSVYLVTLRMVWPYVAELKRYILYELAIQLFSLMLWRNSYICTRMVTAALFIIFKIKNQTNRNYTYQYVCILKHGIKWKQTKITYPVFDTIYVNWSM